MRNKYKGVVLKVMFDDFYGLPFFFLSQ